MNKTNFFWSVEEEGTGMKIFEITHFQVFSQKIQCVEKFRNLI